VTQSVVSAYESGVREPSFSTLTRLVNATGLQLETRVVESHLTPEADLRELVHSRGDDLRSALGRLGASRIRRYSAPEM
jgi:transcriptional regulator with XRE-family HTH domain